MHGDDDTSAAFGAGSSAQASGSMTPTGSEQFQLHAANAKERFLAFTSDARLGAQVLRVRTGVDAKVQAVRDSRTVSSLLEKVGISKSSAAAGVGVDAPTGVDEGVSDLFQEDPALRARIVDFHHNRQHLDSLLPVLQEYHQRRRALAETEQRLAHVLQEAGVQQPGGYGKALTDSGDAHLSASVRRFQAAEDEEKYVTSVMSTHSRQVSDDCHQAVQAYEACRKELKLLHEARVTSASTKQSLQESGASRVDSKLAPTVHAK